MRRAAGAREIRKGLRCNVNMMQLHEEAIAAAAKAGEEDFKMLGARLECFKQRHEHKISSSSSYFEWIRERHSLENEANAACKSLQTFPSAELGSRQHSTNSMDAGLPQEMHQHAQDLTKLMAKQSDIVVDIKKMADDLRSALSLYRQQQSESIKKADCTASILAEVLLDSRERMVTMGIDLEKECIEASKEVQESRRKIMTLLQDRSGDESTVPHELSKKLDLLKKSFQDDSDILLLESELVSLFAEAQDEYQATISDNRTSCPDIECGHWDDRSSTIFSRMFAQWIKMPSPLDKKRIMERLSIELSGKSKEELLARWSWMETSRARKQARKEASERLERKRDSLTNLGLKRANELESTLSILAEQAVVANVNEAVRNEQHARLKLLREAREEAARHMAEKTSEENTRREEREKSTEAMRQEERKKMKAAVKEYKESQEKLAKERLVEDQQREYQEEFERLQRLQQNKGRVLYRQRKREDKIQKEEEAVRVAARAEERKFERLSLLAASVPYYSSIMNASSDLHRTTAARTHDVYEPDATGMADFQHGAKKLRSFTNERVFSDLRFRLGHALHEAGAAQNAYARAVVKRLIPREAERTTGIEPF